MKPAPCAPRDRLRLAVTAFAMLFAVAGLSARVASSHGAAPPAAPAPAALKLVPAAPAAAFQAPPSIKNFEAPQVHPLALTPDGTRLLAANSPNGTLSVFSLTTGAPVLVGEIPVGLEPVSVAARNDREAWVVNWLSDTVSVVDLATGNVVRTIDVGDEPTDVLFAGANGDRAFVCVSGGGRRTVNGTSMTGASGAVKVFDASDPSAAPQVVEIFGKQPRALARDGAGSRVFVSVFESGSQTTVVSELTVRQRGGLPAPNPGMRPGLPPAPNTGLIVRWNGSAWADETGDTKWDQSVNYTLADIDLVTIDASGPAPAVSAQTRGLGTHLGNMAFDPPTGRLFVANLDSTNVRRFEPNLRGRFQANRVSVLNTSGGAPTLASVQDLNPHVDLNNPNGTDAERAQSLALPADIVRASDGTLYVAATSSARVGFLAPDGSVRGRIGVGQGPTGLALDERRARLYVFNRFDMTLGVVDTGLQAQVAAVPVGFNPEPSEVREGRRFLYDASFSAHGTVSCASCHPAGHRDGVAWDLGDPTGDMVSIAPQFTHHPMKGPMVTQSLRGLANATPLHWRADRRDVSEFNVAFTGLLGSTRLLTPGEMAAFVDFVETLSYPPNPNQNHDRSFPNPPSGPNAATGSRRYRNSAGFPPIFLGGANNCNACHFSITPFPHSFAITTIRAVFPGSILSEPQAFKVPQLRGIYQKVGMEKPSTGQPRTEQLTGFGFLHDGSIDTLVNFMKQPNFVGFNNDDERRDIEAFLFSIDSVLAPAVGLQATVNAENKNSPDLLARINLLVQQAQQVPVGGTLFGPGCDLVVRGVYGGAPRGFLRLPDGSFQPDSSSEANVTLQQLLEAAGAGSELTFTGVPVGSGRRFGLDRDGDGVLNDDEPRTSVQITGRVTDAAGNGVAGVTVSLGGAQSAVAQTDSAGRFTFGMVSTIGTYTVTPAGAGLTFAPASRTVTNPAWNQTAYFVAPASPAVVIDATPFFVTQHYNDFLGREPDAPGLAFWTDQINSCGADAACVVERRINVSAAFYLSIEFQQTGFFLHRMTEASFDRMPTYAECFPETQRLGRGVVVGQGQWQAQLEANRQAFVRGWVARTDFRALYDPMSNEQYVGALAARAGVPDGQIDRAGLVAGLNSGAETRASVLRKVVENAAFVSQEKNRAFVLMQYLGYLRRNPQDPPNTDLSGYDFWLGKLNDHGGDFVAAEMVKSFLVSQEYRGRFKQ